MKYEVKQQYLLKSLRPELLAVQDIRRSLMSEMAKNLCTDRGLIIYGYDSVLSYRYDLKPKLFLSGIRLDADYDIVTVTLTATIAEQDEEGRL